jgi:osmotically-inducible protein OsmY
MNAQLKERVRSALDQEPSLSNPAAVAIYAADDTVTLRGTLGSFKQRRVAVDVAKRVRGVTHVQDELTVRLLGDVRSDDELRGAALEALIGDVDVRDEAIDVKVADGWVTLKGEVKHQFQSDVAFEDVARLEGVGGITNEIRIVTA